jgi:hypothetical protein
MTNPLLQRIITAKGFYLVVNDPKRECNPYKGFKFRAS